MDGLAIERHREAVILGFQAERMPFTGGHLDVRARELLAAAFHHLVEADIVLEGIRTRDVVIVGGSETHRDAAGLIFLPGDRLEADCDLDVLRSDRLINGEWKAIVRAIRARLLDRAFAR